MIENLKELDGKCFASIGSNNSKGCSILSVRADGCGTYKCPFYKPEGYSSWIRLDAKGKAVIVSPAEYYRRW